MKRILSPMERRKRADRRLIIGYCLWASLFFLLVFALQVIQLYV